MKEKLLTITVPAYNAERYLEHCLSSIESVADEPKLLDVLEVLIVNDGSSDSTELIGKKFEKKRPGIFHVISKENGGHGSGINTGIANAHGRYFKVVDADDWLNTSELKDYLRMLGGRNEDVVASDFFCVDDDETTILSRKKVDPTERLYGRTVELSKEYLSHVIKMHSMTIRTELLHKMNRQIDEHMYYVDQEYITYPVPYIESVFYDRRYLYMYRLGRNGQSMERTVLCRNRLMHRRVIESLVSYYDYIVKECKLDLSDTKLKYFQRCIGDMIDNQFQIYISIGIEEGMKKELREWDDEIRQSHPELYSATSKKSINLLRYTDYRLLGVAYVAYRLIKG